MVPRSLSHYAVSIFGYPVTSLIVDNNLTYQYDETTANLFIPGGPTQFVLTNLLTADPLFSDTMINSPDVRLQASSRAIDKRLQNYCVLT